MAPVRGQYETMVPLWDALTLILERRTAHVHAANTNLIR